MSFPELARQRCTTRGSTSQPIEKEKPDILSEAGRVAPAACNKQPRRMLVAGWACMHARIWTTQWKLLWEWPQKK